MERKTKILVIDDQPSLLETFTDTLNKLGFQVDVAEDGFNAIERAKETRYDILFMDIKMPGIDGIQTFREIRKIDSKPAVIMMTAYAIAGLVREAIMEGAYTVIAKPFDMEKIISIIQRILKRPAVLVADGKREVIETFRDFLENRHYKVTGAKNAKEAIDLVKGKNFDIIFLDIRLPEVGGASLVEEIQKARPEAAVVMTAFAVEADIQRAIGHGAYTCLFKPVDPESLARVLDDVWEKKRHLSMRVP